MMVYCGLVLLTTLSHKNDKNINKLSATRPSGGSRVSNPTWRLQFAERADRI